MRALLVLAASLLPLGASAAPRFELKGELIRLAPRQGMKLDLGAPLALTPLLEGGGRPRLVPQLNPLPGDGDSPLWPQREVEDWSSRSRADRRPRTLVPFWRPPTRRAGKLATLVGVTTFLSGRTTRVRGDEDWTVEASSYVSRAWFAGSSAVDRLAYASLGGEVLFFRGWLIRPWLGLATGLGGFTRGPLELGAVLVLESSVGLQVTLAGDLRASLELAYQVAPCVDCPRDLARPQRSWPVLTLSLRYRARGGERAPFPWGSGTAPRGETAGSVQPPPPW